MCADDKSITLGGEDAYQLLEDLRNELQDIIDWLRQEQIKPKCNEMQIYVLSKFDETSSNAVNSLLQPLCKALETSFRTSRIRVSWKPKRPEALTQTLTAGNLTEICNLQTISFRQIL